MHFFAEAIIEIIGEILRYALERHPYWTLAVAALVGLLIALIVWHG